MTEAPTSHVVLRCDAHPSFGVGHLVRCLALAQELLARGSRVTLLGGLGGIAWLERLVADSAVPVIPPADEIGSVCAQVVDLGADAVVLDGYHLQPALGEALREAGVTVLAMVDGEFGAVQEADVYIDQNLGAVPHTGGPDGSLALAGVEYAMFRDSVLDRRRTGTVPAHRPPRVLAVFGGTDPYDAARTVVPQVLDLGEPVELTVVAAREEVRTALAALPTGPGQTVHAIEPVADLAALAVEQDLAISASGSSVWELLCLGVPTAVVCVADNQRLGYEMTVAEGVVVPVGVLDDLRAQGSVPPGVRRLLTDTDHRADLARRGRALVDGDGRARVSTALLNLTRRGH
ncbi:hypothetical protein PZ938_15325 [Luteipulveratus sp. YIM 133132]|uniref:PseG/SpsG family protein n=1 Tax=Luteipulveratus flavus TaxID=3031728 RepID=UPI0023AEF01B|nr:hypothetical protein [Luteipulveratus sp. YIM 133132]MDE9366986.1 hypothetical protein [Luteipulveratus sp. YIM 133132]